MRENEVPQGLAAGWLDNHHLAKLPEREQMIKDLPLFKGCSVLDAGCGTGNFLELLLRHPAHPALVVGIDNSLDLLKVAKQKLDVHINTNRLALIPCDIDCISDIEQDFDLVWSAHILPYSTKPVETLQNLMKVVKPGGYLVSKEEDAVRSMMLSFDPKFELALLEAWLSIVEEWDYHHDPHVGRKLYGLFQKAGLSKIEVKTYLIERTYPFSESVQQYIFRGFFNYKDGFKKYLDKKNWENFQKTFDPDSNTYLFKSKDLHFISTETVATGQVL